jgi:recombination protein RecA
MTKQPQPSAHGATHAHSSQHSHAPHKPGHDNVRAKALELAIGQIEKNFGAGAMMRLGDSPHQRVEGISTGVLSLDLALGGFGIPRGRIAEIYGPESSGKTTLCLNIIANAQKTGGVVAFIDAEHALDPQWAKFLGVDIDNLYVSQPDNGEQALDIAEVLIRSAAIDVVVIDSVAALVPRAELQGEMGDSHVGLHARLMSQSMRKLTAAISRSNTCVIFTNQIREKIGVMFGNPETTTGGKALKFYASVRIEIRRTAQIKNGEDVIGHGVTAKVVKNKIAPPFKKAEFELIFSEGFSVLGDLIELGTKCNVIKRSGAWLGFGDKRLGQGKENAKQYLRDNPADCKALERAVRGALGATPELHAVQVGA